MASTYQVLASYTASTPQLSTFSFTSIPQTYTDLAIRINARTTLSSVASNMFIVFNGDTSTNYSQTFIRINGLDANTVASRTTSYSSHLGFQLANGANSTSDAFSTGEIYISNYTSTSAKPFKDFHATETNSLVDAYLTQSAGLYRGTSISSISFTAGSSPDFDGILAGSSFYLYGIKNS
jgi:hypothetical protein